MTLRTKILLLLFPLITVPLLLTGWFAYEQLKQNSEHKVFDQVNTIFNYMNEDFIKILHTSKANIELLSVNELLQTYLLASDKQERYTTLQEPILNLFKNYKNSYPEYNEIRLLLPDGHGDTRQTSTFIENITEEEANTEYFQFISNSQNDVTTSIRKNPNNEKFSLYISKRITLHDPANIPTSAKPKLRAYLIITVDLAPFGYHFNDKNKKFNGFLLAVNDKNEIVFNSEHIPFPDKILPASVAQHSTQIANSDNFSLVLLNGMSYYFKGVILDKNIWVFAGIPLNLFIQESYKLALGIAAITLLTLFITLLSTYMILERIIIKPIHRLREATKEISSGNYIVDIGTISDDEVGELAKAFADMGKNIENSNERIRTLAYHDNLTGLPNRHMFHHSLQRLLKQAYRNDEKFAILYIDVDDFKRINDTLGHQVGDLFLQDVSSRISSILREDDYVTYVDSEDNFVARLGGDEFIIILPRLSESLAAIVVAERLIQELANPFKMHKQEFFVGASIGITIFPDDGDNANTLIKNADIAMYHAKSLGKNNYKYFSESMNLNLKRKFLLENKLRKAIEAGWLTLHYQPIIDVNTGAVVSLEGLCRWEDPELGLVSPEEFIPLAEESGLIIPLGKWVIEEACRQNKTWQEQGFSPIPIAINVSSIQFDRQDLPTCIIEALAKSGLDAQYLTIEITENSIIKSPELTIDVLERIKKLGVNISLDDFGSGYSSLSYLRNFPINTLKIDRGFTKEMSVNNDKSTIVSAILLMAHTLNLKVIAEGIQDKDQFDFLKVNQCDQVQGYLFSRPVPGEQIPQLLATPCLKTA